MLEEVLITPLENALPGTRRDCGNIKGNLQGDEQAEPGRPELK
jgi:hypothetical protein